MTSGVTCINTLITGTLSRYIKPSWLNTDRTIEVSAFDLRERTPPEKYVSFFKTQGNSQFEHVLFGYNEISRKFQPSTNGAIILIDISETLHSINDDEDDLIAFVQKELPHCGLVYHTNNIVEIQEIKTTLCFLAKKQLRLISEISNNSPACISNSHSKSE